MPEVVFTRRPPEALSDPEQLQKFAGQYELPGMIATVAVQGSKLTVTVPGQPTYELLPYRSTEFNLKGLQVSQPAVRPGGESGQGGDLHPAERHVPRDAERMSLLFIPFV
ncbi:MAG TPA: hypothetical protein VF756_15375 [Thermoanaerobaculia bacterium]